MKCKLIIALALCALAFTVGAQDAPVTPEAAEPSGAVGFVNKLIDQVQGKAPWLAAVIGIMGALRLAMKPIMEGFYAFVKATPSTKDDEFYDKVQRSKALKIVNKLLDYVASIKLVHPSAGK